MATLPLTQVSKSYAAFGNVSVHLIFSDIPRSEEVCHLQFFFPAIFFFFLKKVYRWLLLWNILIDIFQIPGPQLGQRLYNGFAAKIEAMESHLKNILDDQEQTIEREAQVSLTRPFHFFAF